MKKCKIGYKPEFFEFNLNFSGIRVGNKLKAGNYIFPYTGPILFVQPDMTIPVRGRIAAFHVNVAHVINSRTGEVVKPVHFVVLRSANEKLSEFQIVGRKMVTDFTMGNLTVGISSFWNIFLSNLNNFVSRCHLNSENLQLLSLKLLKSLYF